MMLTRISKLGSLLFTILALFIMGGVLFVFTEHISVLSTLALSAVILFLGTTFIVYFLHDLYLSKQEKYLQDLKKSQKL